MLEFAAYMQDGMGIGAAGLAANRLALGTFFSISGYHKLFNKARHSTLVETLRRCHVPAIRFNQWFVPAVEFLGGLALLTGILSPLAAFGLMAICLVAICTDGVKRLPAMKPIDKADWLDDLLYLPETLYLAMLTVIVVAGPGAFTLI